MRSIACRVTSAALKPGCLDRASVTAGDSPVSSMPRVAAAGPAPNQA